MMWLHDEKAGPYEVGLFFIHNKTTSAIKKMRPRPVFVILTTGLLALTQRHPYPLRIVVFLL